MPTELLCAWRAEMVQLRARERFTPNFRHFLCSPLRLIPPWKLLCIFGFHITHCLAVERGRCWVGLHYRTQVCAMELRSHPITGIFFFFFFFPPEFDLPLTYLWQLQCRRTDKINNAHISGLLWNWNLLKLIEHVGIWYIELLAKKLTFMKVYNGILDLNDHLSARKSR